MTIRYGSGWTDPRKVYCVPHGGEVVLPKSVVKDYRTSQILVPMNPPKCEYCLSEMPHGTVACHNCGALMP